MMWVRLKSTKLVRKNTTKETIPSESLKPKCKRKTPLLWRKQETKSLTISKRRMLIRFRWAVDAKLLSVNVAAKWNILGKFQNLPQDSGWVFNLMSQWETLKAPWREKSTLMLMAALSLVWLSDLRMLSMVTTQHSMTLTKMKMLFEQKDVLSNLNMFIVFLKTRILWALKI